MSATAYDAIADPTRRQLLRLVAEGERTAGELASQFTISRPAVSRHLRVLREAGLVRASARSRERVYALEPAPLNEIKDWLVLHNNAVMAMLFLVFAAKLIADALPPLS